MSFKSVISNSATHATRARHVVLTAIGVTALSLLAANVRAEEAGAQATVSLAGLNLATQGDATKAYARLRRAAKAVCQELDDKDVHSKQQYAKCYGEALGNAVAAIDHRNVTALHDAGRALRIAQGGNDSARGS